jgi:hypothetical protein
MLCLSLVNALGTRARSVVSRLVGSYVADSLRSSP